VTSEAAVQILERLNATSSNTLMAHLGIEYTAVGEGYLEATMPVTANHHQPMGILHGGASAALAESVGSAASALQLDLSRQFAVGLALDINHLKSMTEGQVTARAEAIHLGRSTHLWDIRLRNEKGQTTAVSRLSMMVLDRD
jgi:1,4-dihydroxy-2-naphthoyl-CoA hydrolase